MKVRKTSKKFLSDTPYEYGSVCWEVCVDPKDRYDLIQADIRITDCNENISLQFSSQKEKHLDKRIQKLDNLIDSLKEMRKVHKSKEVADTVKTKLKAREGEKND